MLVEKTDVLRFIPQQPPMVMVDGLIASDEFQSRSSLVLSEKNIFCEDGFFTEAGLIENMAQTAALRAGYEAQTKGEKVKTGFIGAVKNFTLHQLPKDNSTLTTTINLTHNFGNITLIKGEVWSNSVLLAEAELSIFTQEDNT
jgi:predicted hotdog family 3-hydroxylacyl-ACP dehydratase